MELSERECQIVQEVLFHLKDCEQIKLILEADFRPDREAGETKDKLNAYACNSLLHALVYPWAKLFFIGQLHYDTFTNPNIHRDLLKFLKAKFDQMSFSSGWLSSFFEKKWVDFEEPKVKVRKGRVTITHKERK